jgi:hypothetical protein
VLSGLAVLLAVAWAPAQDKPPTPTLPAVQPQPQPLPTLPFGGGDLISAKGLEKLGLSKEQQADYDKIAGEYKKKQKELQEKLFELMKKPTPEGMRGHFEAQNKLRPDYLAKVEKLLTDDQKKTLETLRNELPGFGPIGFPQFPPAIMRPFGQSIGAPFLPADAQKELKLTDDQKKKVEELQKDLETKIMGLLTDEQKKAFEEMKKRPGGFGPGGFGPGIGLPPPPPPLELPKLPLPGIDKQVVPPPPAVEPTRPPELKKIEK